MRTRLTWLAVGIAVALIGTAVYSQFARNSVVTLRGSGLSIDLPSSWDGKTYENGTGLRVLQAASVPLPLDGDDDVGNKTVAGLGSDDLFISVWYWPDWPPKDTNSPTPRLPLPVQITRADFDSFEGQVAPAMAQRVGAVDGKLVQIRVAFGNSSPSDELIAEANRVLRTFAVVDPKVT
jgi:hypothetical protein